MPEKVPRPTLRVLFESLDIDSNGVVDNQEVDHYLRGIGLRGWLVRRATHKFFMGEADKDRRDGCVSWGEFVAGAHLFMPPAVVVGVDVRPELVNAAFDKIAGAGCDQAGFADLRRYSREAIPWPLRPFSGPLLDVAAKAVLKALDANRDGILEREDLRTIVDDIVRERARR